MRKTSFSASWLDTANIFLFRVQILNQSSFNTSTVVKCRAFAGSTACLIGTLFKQRVEGYRATIGANSVLNVNFHND